MILFPKILMGLALGIGFGISNFAHRNVLVIW